MMNMTQILVVEDESIVALDIKNRLKLLGYQVPGLASTGEVAIEKAETLHPDLVLMDIRLKGEMDGIQAAEQIRARLDIPVIFVTAYADKTTLERAKITEPYGYLIKPFEGKELHTTIEMALYRHKMQRKLKESERWLSITLNSIGDGVIATDADGNIKFMNPIAETLTGWTQADAFGKNSKEVFNIINEKTRLCTDSPIFEALQTGKVVELEENTVLIAKNGTEIPIDDSAAPIIDDQDQTMGAVLVFRDITQRKQTEQALRQYMIELQTRNDELDAFAGTVAHDLQNPLGTILGYAELLEEVNGSSWCSDSQDFLDAIKRIGGQMSNIIQALLLLAQVRKVDVAVKPLDMGSIVAAVQDRLSATIQEHQAEIVIPATWPESLGYSVWVEEIWANYISNGIKYGGNPPRIELGASTNSDGMVRFWVRDNGSGLSPEDQARLFTPFTQLQPRYAGHGLGLSIVQCIVDKLDGQVGVESKENNGSIFYFTLPCANGTTHKERTQLIENTLIER